MNPNSDSQLNLQQLFEVAPGCFLVLAPDSPRFTILAATDAYLLATRTRRDEILGKGVFEVFPDNPDDPDTKAVDVARASFQRVVEQHCPDVMGVRKHDIRRLESEGGGFEERFWNVANFPVLAADGRVLCIIHRVEDATEFIQLERQRVEQQAANIALRDSRRAALNLMEDAVIARRQAEEAGAELRESEQRLRRFYESGLLGVIYWNMNGEITDANAKFLEMLGYDRADLAAGRLDWGSMTPPEYRHLDERSRLELKATGVSKHPFETEYLRKDGTRLPILIAGAMLDEARFNGVAFVLDITERKKAQEESATTSEFLKTINQATGTRELVHAAVTFFHQQSRCEAVGVRLKEGDDFPYYEAHGFPEEFLRLENSLCERDDDGKIQRDSVGNPCIACMCGNVICGRFDPSKPFFSPHGSFWTNCTTDLLASTTAADRQARTRNRCNGQGYESVALIPLRFGDECLGLLQLNDKRKGLFTDEAIRFWERLAGHLAIALAKARAEEALHQSEERYRSLFNTLLEGFCVIEMIFDSAGKPVDYRFLEINPAFESQTGLQNAKGRLMRELAPDNEARWYETYGKVALTGEPTRFVNEAKALNRWYDVSAYRVGGSESRKVAILFNDITERKRAEEALRGMNLSLERRVAERTEEVRQQADQLRALASDLSQTEQRERKRLAAILHDHIQQLLVAAQMQVDLIKRTGPDVVQSAAQGVESILKEAITASRSLTVELSPPILHQAGLAAGLGWLANRMKEKHLFNVHVQADHDAAPMDESMRFLLFESVRELLLNAVKYSGVKEAQVAMLRTPEGWTRIVVEDQGQGFDPATLHARQVSGASFGLFSIQQRLVHLGGRMEIESVPGGTRVILLTPPEKAAPMARSPPP